MAEESRSHTVEKIGGTSMSRFEEVYENIIRKGREATDVYQRILVVSAYAGITDLLLEHKKTREPGVYSLFVDTAQSWAWGDAISRVCDRMCEINSEIFQEEGNRRLAEAFVRERIEGVRSCLIDLHRLCGYGHFQLDEHLATVREMLSALGEAHSAYNLALLLRSRGINATFVDLTGWREVENLPLDEKLTRALEEIDLAEELPIVTGYAQCKEGLMKTFDRGYTEITFSRLAVLTRAREAIIHKEFQLCSADPKLLPEDKARVIDRTSYDVADQLSEMGMEAIHPRAAKGLRQQEIPLRIKSTFEPHSEGTLIHRGYVSPDPRVEIIAGRPYAVGIEVHDPEMVGSFGHDERILELLKRYAVSYEDKDTNANTITHYVVANLERVRKVAAALQREFPGATITLRRVAIVSVASSNLAIPGLLVRAVSALAESGIGVLGVHQNMRNVDLRFIVAEGDYEASVAALHASLVEEKKKEEETLEVPVPSAVLLPLESVV